VAFSFARAGLLFVETKKNPAPDFHSFTILKFSGFKLKGLQRDHVAGACKKNTLLKKRAACDGRTVL